MSHDRRRSDAPSDADVVARVLDGDKQQSEHLVRRYQSVAYRHAVSIVLDHDAAADTGAVTFVRAYLNLRECRDTSRFRRMALSDPAQPLLRPSEGRQPAECSARRR